MNWLIYHIASGQAFFGGVALIIIAAFASTYSTAIAKRVTVMGFLIGAIAVTISSTAIPYWYYGIASVITIAWLTSGYVKKWRRWAPFAVMGAWVIAAAIESPYHIMPSLAPASSRSITVIGDSVTAGMGSGDKTVRWPTLLAKQHRLEVQDISYPGETVASALSRAKSQQITSPLVILEIGGNDLLGDTTSAQFSRDLDALLTYVDAPGRQVIMFELPLPPFNHEYGRIQRSLASRHNVKLVPKRVLLSILAANESTIDTIHLSQAGHDRMAACVWELIRSVFPAKETAAAPIPNEERSRIRPICLLGDSAGNVSGRLFADGENGFRT
ncbi:MAG: acyl-CoA thioesterase [Rhodopirellula sp.]|nr:acyl-CoA thioesterase [Rhodopirellula sp.]